MLIDTGGGIVKRKRFSPCRVDPALTEKNIGKVVKVQVFDRKGEDELNLETMQKYVGTLKAYSYDSASILIRIDGLDSILVARHYHSVEVFQ